MESTWRGPPRTPSGRLARASPFEQSHTKPSLDVFHSARIERFTIFSPWPVLGLAEHPATLIEIWALRPQMDALSSSRDSGVIG